MKKLIIIIVFFFTGCATKSPVLQSVREEYEIVRLALEEYKTVKYNEFRVMQKPQNGIIVNYFNGLYQGPIDLPGVTFSFTDNHITTWDDKLIGKAVAEKKIIIIENYNNVKEVLHSELEKADIYFSLSNPIFSNDGQYALINITHFYNLNLSPGQSYIMIFRKVNGKWIYYDKFESSVS